MTTLRLRSDGTWTAHPGAVVTITAVTGSKTPAHTSDGELIGPIVRHLDADGELSIDLPSTEIMEPAGCHYLVECSGQEWRHILPATGGPYDVGDPAIVAPPGPAPSTWVSGPPGPGVPEGGTTGQVLTKDSSTDFDTSWQAPTGGGGGGVALGETSTTAYRGDRGKTAYDHSQITGANPHGTTAAQVGADPAGTAAGLSTADRARANHTGVQPSSTISDFVEAVQDTVAALLAAGTGVSVSYDDTAGTLTLTATGGGGSTDPEVVRDTIGVALAGVGLITVTVNDVADTITIATTATANDTDANLKARANHTGTQSLDTTTDSAASGGRLAMTTAERTKVGGVAAGATANATDAQLRDRTTHSGAQPISSVTNLQSSLDAKSDKAATVSTRTGSYTLVLADADAMQVVDAAGATTLSIPTDASVAFPAGTRIPIVQRGAGRVTVAAVTPGTTTVLFPPVGTNNKTRGAGSMAMATKIAANYWVISGDVAP